MEKRKWNKRKWKQTVHYTNSVRISGLIIIAGFLKGKANEEFFDKIQFISPVIHCNRHHTKNCHFPGCTDISSLGVPVALFGFKVYLSWIQFHLR